MIIGVMSDTHGNRKLMHHVADRMVDEFGAELIYHAGDNYGDAEELGYSGVPVRKVPGLWCDEYHEAHIPNEWREVHAGLPFACVHVREELSPEGRKAAIIIYGHTHAPAIEQVNGSLWLNPGHLKRPQDRGHEASFAMLNLGPQEVAVRVHGVDGAIRVQRAIPRGALAAAP